MSLQELTFDLMTLGVKTRLACGNFKQCDHCTKGNTYGDLGYPNMIDAIEFECSIEDEIPEELIYAYASIAGEFDEGFATVCPYYNERETGECRHCGKVIREPLHTWSLFAHLNEPSPVCSVECKARVEYLYKLQEVQGYGQDY